MSLPLFIRLPSLLILFSLWMSLVKCQASNQTSNTSTNGSCPVEIPGYEHHGDCNLLCKKASWADILQFYMANYVAHAATILTSPGQSTIETFYNAVSALCLPGAGVARGISAIFCGAKFGDKTDLQVAARAGALCAVMRTPGTRRQAHASGEAASIEGGQPQGIALTPTGPEDEGQRQAGDSQPMNLIESTPQIFYVSNGLTCGSLPFELTFPRAQAQRNIRDPNSWDLSAPGGLQPCRRTPRRHFRRERCICTAPKASTKMESSAKLRGSQRQRRNQHFQQLQLHGNPGIHSAAHLRQFHALRSAG